MGNGKKNKRRQKATKATFTGNQRNTLQLEPLLVAIQLKFSDPEDKARPFPKDFQVEVVYGDNLKTETRKIDNNEGNLILTVTRSDAAKYEFIRLQFKSLDKNYIICEKKGDAIKTPISGNVTTAEEQGKTGQRFFRLPPKWSFLTSDWTVAADEKIYNSGQKEKKFLLVEVKKPRSIGTKAEPVKALLNPHWQYVKFEYFDRFYGHSDHDNKPISIPAITVDGFFKAAEKADVKSNWTVNVDNDEKKTIQCLPWILQAKADGTAEPKPDKDSILQFKQPKDTYIISKSATDRTLKSMVAPLEKDDALALRPCANRLKYYDLPELWKSGKYWCRVSDEKTDQGFFEKMAEKKTELKKPLIFSLDDIVLTDDKIAPLSMQQTDKIVLFYHEFLDAIGDPNKKGTGGRDGAKYLKNGLYKPGLDQAAINAQAKVEKEPREKAEAKRREREEHNAREIAEDKAEKAGAKKAEIKKAGDDAVAALANNKEIQQQIKDAGDKAAAQATKNALREGKIKESTENIKVLALETHEVVGNARTNQRAIEEKPYRDEAEEKQRKIEEQNARRTATEQARKYGFSPKEINASGERAVANVVNDKEAENRIKTAGNNAASGVNSDKDARDRINMAGKRAEDSAFSFPYSDILRDEKVPNYIFDYPHWTRLVVNNGNLFDNFDKRTTSGDVIGARAAVRLVDATADGVGVKAEEEITNLPDIVPGKEEQEKVYAIEQPYYRQNFFMSSSNGSSGQNRPQGFYDEWGSPIAANDNKVDPIGRNDVILLRSSNYKDTNEEAVVFVYHRLNIDFTSEPNALGDTLPTPEADFSKNPPHFEADADKRKEMRHTWTKDFVSDCGNRWSGNDTVNTTRPWIQEKKDADPKFRAQIVSFLQHQTYDNAHFKIKMLGSGSWMAIDGTAEFEIEDFRDTAGMGFDQKFAGAHEYGHAGGQPDDYAPSAKGQTNFGSNDSPGAPFILDRMAMMSSNNQIRARSYWHMTELLRKLKPFKDTKFQVLHGGYEYEIPHYNHADRPGRNFTHWPVKAKIFHTATNPVYFDSFLYFLGKDEYSQVVLPSQPDGIIVVLLKTYVEFQEYTDQDVIIRYVFNKLKQKIETALNTTRVHAQFDLPGIDRGTTNTFMKCMLHFSARFEEDEGDNYPAHLKIKIKAPDSSDPVMGWSQVNSAGTKTAGPVLTEMQVHGKLNDGSFTKDTKLTQSESGTTSWSAPQQIKNWSAFEAAFTKDADPRKLQFRFPECPSNVDELAPATDRLTNIYFKHICEMVGLSDDTTKANSYDKADAYKGIIKACINNNGLNPTMSR